MDAKTYTEHLMSDATGRWAVITKQAAHNRHSISIYNQLGTTTLRFEWTATAQQAWDLAERYGCVKVYLDDSIAA